MLLLKTQLLFHNSYIQNGGDTFVSFFMHAQSTTTLYLHLNGC